MCLLNSSVKAIAVSLRLIPCSIFPVFSEGNDILTICPRIMTSFSVPSFRLEPTSSAPEFLNGSYEYRAESLPAGIQFNPEYERCDNSDGMMCSKLSLLYRDGQSVGRDSITVTYTASNGAVRVIRINYGEFFFVLFFSPLLTIIYHFSDG